eukprot:GAHX01002114.1.p1 GENE.GAHX01002114.1~~GAHX01002114.1.p1  ORF type:complete len:142 (+),score=25.89 GAHX01002114.1:39-464(+)
MITPPEFFHLYSDNTPKTSKFYTPPAIPTSFLETIKSQTKLLLDLSPKKASTLIEDIKNLYIKTKNNFIDILRVNGTELISLDNCTLKDFGLNMGSSDKKLTGKIKNLLEENTKIYNDIFTKLNELRFYQGIVNMNEFMNK